MPTTISDRIRRDIDTIARQYIRGKSLTKIAEKYGCNYKLVERIMKQTLPVSYFTELARRRIERQKEGFATVKSA